MDPMMGSLWIPFGFPMDSLGIPYVWEDEEREGRGGVRGRLVILILGKIILIL